MIALHSAFSPSAAHRWLRCPGSVALEAQLPPSTSEYAEEGTRAHEIAAQVLDRGAWPDGVDPEMRDAVAAYTAAVDVERRDADSAFVEQRVDFSESIGAPGFGTVDCLILKAGELQVHDLKYGRGVKVDAVGNDQLRLYALGALEQFGMTGAFDRVRLFIHQPRLDHVDEWAVTRDELEAFRTDVVDRVAGTAAGDATLAPGETQCRFCRAKAHCPALARHVAETVEGDFEDLTKAVDGIALLDRQAVAEALASVDLVERWCEAIRRRAFDELAAGEDVPGFKLVEGRRGARKWSDETEAEAMLKAMRLKIEEMYDLSLISPTTAKKLNKAGTIGPRQWPRLQGIIVQAAGKPSVAPVTDKRPAISLAATAADFADLT